ncbi:MAG: tetraacyldisaccharide 4'-kinase [Betaproteobacteria bacterium]|nr:tetraacyldisaccharide 4'-kinase [Betaproteobacteria bacterium]
MSARGRAGTWLAEQWYARKAWLGILLPVAIVFRVLAGMRRAGFARGWARRVRLPVPVIVVGNITVGGTGKTPLVLWLVDFLRRAGLRPGIVARGYGGERSLQAVAPDADPGAVGDEPLLLARRAGCPVWVGRDRAAAGAALLAAHPECDVLVADDGLQHYRLARDFEIAVVDGARGFGNRLPLPAGPLREPVSRLNHCDAVVVNGVWSADDPPPAAAYRMGLVGERLCSVREPGRCVEPRAFEGKRVRAIAGIGNPQRFFDELRRLGMRDFDRQTFPDHYAFTAADLAFDGYDAIVMTEKDAVKCTAFAAGHWWMLQVRAEVDPALGERILTELKQ